MVKRLSIGDLDQAVIKVNELIDSLAESITDRRLIVKHARGLYYD